MYFYYIKSQSTFETNYTKRLLESKEREQKLKSFKEL